jgi:molybdate transport system substrate-binding protein
MSRRAVMVLLCLVLVLGCKSGQEPADTSKVTIYAAASTREAVEQIAREFKAETGIDVEISPGASSRLSRQISEGGPADLFLSADQANADYLKDKDLVGERRNLLGNRLVVVVPADSTLKLEKLDELPGKVKLLALAADGVPAGEYARDVLKHEKVAIWDQVKDRVAGGDDVRATLAHVEKGADAGFVYRTDTIGNSRVKIALEVDPQLHRPIEYPLILIKRPQIKENARKFYAYLRSDKAAAIFRQARFEVIE